MALGTAHADQPIPPVARVTDLAATLSAPQKAGLEAKLAAFEQGKGSQIAVLIVPTTEPETIEQYAIRVAEAWKLGRKGVDDGALLLVAKGDHALRIEVGYGLEGALPDAIAKRIVEEHVLPRFRAGDFAGGIDRGVDRMIEVIGGEPLPPPPERRSAGGENSSESVLPFLIMVPMFLANLLRSLMGRLPAALLSAVGTGVLGMLLGAGALGVVIAIVVFVFVLGGGGRGGFGGFGGGRGRVGGFGGGGFGGGGGGFSGGGGGFGGGGASGRW
ncbi:MAG TPA: TPM domain-containing protein [Solimonas sp.]|nr:TPM domain-containing protein [Solimonas sp.]